MSSYCTNCSPCNSCQGDCVGCKKCDSGCMVSCDSAQTWCALEKETIQEACGQEAFAFSYRPVANSSTSSMGPGQFDKSVWDEIATWISKRAALPTETPETKTKGDGAPGGTTNAVGGTVVAASTVADVVPFSAAEFNRISATVDGPTAVQNAVITAQIFLDLETAANSKKVAADACKMCNANCDNSCNICEKCDSCQGCEGCEGCVDCQACEGCSGDCESCDGCESDETTPCIGAEEAPV